MAKDLFKSYKGIAYGCGSVGLIILLIIAGGFFYVKGQFDEFNEIDKSLVEMEEKYGSYDEFLPTKYNVVEEDKLNAFIKTKKDLKEFEVKLDDSFNTMDFYIQELKESSFWTTIDIVKTAVKVIKKLLDYYHQRNLVLLENNLSLGEYYYLYALINYSYLGKDPGDGPGFNLFHKRGNEKNITLDFDEDETVSKEKLMEDARIKRFDHITFKVNKMFRSILGRLKERSLEQNEQSILENEIAELEKNPHRIPWAGNFPVELKDVLDRYKTELESIYSETINSIETNPIKN